MRSTIFAPLRSTKLQLWTIIITLVYVALMVGLEYNTHVYPEKIPKLLDASPQVKYTATPIEVGVHINSFPEFSFNLNTFTLDAIVWFKFAKGSESLDTLEKFTLKNSLLGKNGKLIYKSAPIIKLMGNEEVLVSYHVIASFRADLNHDKFPIGDHKLIFILQNQSVTPNELYFKSSNDSLTLSDDLSVDNWKAEKTSAKAGYVRSVINPKTNLSNITYPCVVFSIDFNSFGARNVISLYFPIFVIFFICLLSLIVPIYDYSRLGIISTALPILVLFRMVIESASPKVGYTTHIDNAYYTLVLLSVVLLIVQVYITLEGKKIGKIPDTDTVKQESIQKLEDVNNITLFAILGLLILFVTGNFLL